MAGFDNETMYAINADFSGSATPSESNGLTTDGKLWIGSTALNPGNTHINAGEITSTGGTILVTYDSPNINIDLAGGSTGIDSILTESGAPPVVPDGTGQVTFTGGDGIDVTGNGPGNTVTFSIDDETVGQTITGDDAVALSPTAGNWNILGQQAGTIPVMETDGTAPSTLRIEDRSLTTRFVVDPSATVGLRGTFQTIGAAITAASSGDVIFVRPGTYTENITAKAGVSVVAYDVNITPIIIGKISCNMAAAGECLFSGFKIQTNNDYAVSFTGSNQNFLTFQNCVLVATNNDLVEHTNSSATSILTFDYCVIDRSGAFSLFTSSAAGFLQLLYTRTVNAALATTASTMSAGFFRAFFCEFRSPITTSGTNDCLIQNSLMRMDNINATAFTCGGSGTNISSHCFFKSGTSTAISVGAILTLTQAVVDSSNTNAISGAGTLNYGQLDFSGSSSNVNVTNQNPLKPGFLAINTTGDDNVTGDGTLYTVICNSEIFDIGGDYNNATGTFTAPSTDKYQLSFQVAVEGMTTGMTEYSADIVTSNRSIRLGQFTSTALNLVNQRIPFSALLDMDNGDTAVIKITCSGGAKVVDIEITNTFFSGSKYD